MDGILNRMTVAALVILLLLSSLTSLAEDARLSTVTTSGSPMTFPGDSWEVKTPAEVNLDSAILNEFIANIGGTGVIIRNGYLVESWGSGGYGEWASAAKPVWASLLFAAIEDGLVLHVDQSIAEYDWELTAADEDKSFRHLANMISGYARAEDPGDAWAYNDYAISLYVKTLFDRVYGVDSTDANEVKNLINSQLGALDFENGSFVQIINGGPRLTMTPGDFARIGWLWLNKGNWDGQQILPHDLLDTAMMPQVPNNLPLSTAGDVDYLAVGTIGGTSYQVDYGPGIYGYGWWFNSLVGTTANLTWPDAPEDLFMASGHWDREIMVMIPSLNMVVAARGGWGAFQPGNAQASMNTNLSLLAQAVQAPPLTETPNPTSAPTATPPSGCAGSIDTIGIYRSSDFSWYLRNMNSAGYANSVFNYGLPSDVSVVGDWNGDGYDTVGIRRGDTFYLKNDNSSGSADLTFAFGAPSDIPIAGDWNGDGIDTIGVYRPSTATWYLRNSNSSGGANIAFGYGLFNETPVAGDWDGDGVDTIGIYRDSDFSWYLRNSNSAGFAETIINFGLPSDDAVVGDWNGDCVDTIGIYRSSEGNWYLKNSNTTGIADLAFAYGLPNERGVTGHWIPYVTVNSTQDDAISVPDERPEIEDEVTATLELTQEPSPEATIEATKEPSPVSTETPVPTLTATNTAEPTTTLEPTSEPSLPPEPTAAPILPTAQPTIVPAPSTLPVHETFDNLSEWTITGEWLRADDCNMMGACMTASTRPRGQISSLTHVYGIDMTTLPAGYDVVMTILQFAKLAPEDLISYEVSSDAGATWQPLLVLPGMNTEWSPLQIDLSSYVGQIIQLRITVDTRVPLPENTESIGYRIDELRIEAAAPALPTEEPTQSASATPTPEVTGTLELPTETQPTVTPDLSPTASSTSTVPPTWTATMSSVPTATPTATSSPFATATSSTVPSATKTETVAPTETLSSEPTNPPEE